MCRKAPAHSPRDGDPEYMQFSRGTVNLTGRTKLARSVRLHEFTTYRRRITMLLVTTKVEDVDHFLGVFSTKGAEKRAKHGSKGATLFRDPNDEKRVWIVFDWDTEGWDSFIFRSRGAGNLQGRRPHRQTPGSRIGGHLRRLTDRPSVPINGRSTPPARVFPERRHEN